MVLSVAGEERTQVMQMEWSDDKEGILYWIALIEETLRLTWYQVNYDIKPTIVNRLRYHLQHVCKHEQDLDRDVEHAAAFSKTTTVQEKKEEADTKRVHT